MIRDARPSDFERCLEMAQAIIPTTSYRDFAIDPRETRKVWNSLIISPLGYVRVLDDKKHIKAFLIGVLDEVWFTRRQYQASDLITIIMPGTPYGFEIVHDFVDWAKQHHLKPKQVRLGLSSGLVPAVMLDRLYRREGFTHTGGLFYKDLQTDSNIVSMSAHRMKRTGS